MAASEKDPRTMRRKAAGEDPNKMSVKAQPLPGQPQNQKAGNVENYAFSDVNGQMSQSMGTEAYRYPYGDGGLPLNDGRRGAVGFVSNSGQAQNLVQGRGQNLTYGLPQLGAPGEQAAGQMEVAHAAMTAQRDAQRVAPQNPEPSYMVTPMGPGGRPTTPGGVNPSMTYVTPTNLSLQGTPDVEARGMSTKRGGGRNKKAG